MENLIQFQFMADEIAADKNVAGLMKQRDSFLAVNHPISKSIAQLFIDKLKEIEG